MARNGGHIYPGFIYLSSDEILLGFYFRKKIDGQEPDDQILRAMPTLDLFGRDALPPWLLHPAASTSSSKNSSSCKVFGSSAIPSKVTDWFYSFARTSRRGSGSCRTTSCGTWLTGGGDRRVMGSVGGEDQIVTLGYKSTFAFKIPTSTGSGGGGSKWAPTGWIMHEFKLHRGGPDVRRKAAAVAATNKNKNDRRILEEAAGELVLCKIRCTKPMEPSKLNSGLGFGAMQLDGEVGRPQKRQRTGYSASRPDWQLVRSEREGGQASLQVSSSRPSPSSSSQCGFGSTYVKQQVVVPATPAAVDVELVKTEGEGTQNSVRTDLLGSPSSPCSSQCGSWSNSVEQQVVTPPVGTQRHLFLRTASTNTA